MQPLPVQHELQFALAHAGFGIADRLPGAAVPGLDRAGAVLAFRDRALEFGVVERMVLDMRREPPVGGIERGSLAAPPSSTARRRAPAGNPSAARPAGPRASAPRTSAPPLPGWVRRRRLGGEREIALGAVGPDRGVADRAGFGMRGKRSGGGGFPEAERGAPCA